MKSFLTGLATGLAIGLLTAPRSGKQTRTQLTDMANQQTKKLKAQWDNTVSRANGLIADLKATSESSEPAPNLFAQMESGEKDKYLDEGYKARRAMRETAGQTVGQAEAPSATV